MFIKSFLLIILPLSMVFSSVPAFAFQRALISWEEGVLTPAPYSEFYNILNSKNIASIEGYAEWLKDNFQYKKDVSGDYWAKPEETLLEKTGDCEDFAFLNQAALRLFGYKSEVFIVKPLKTITLHAICVFKKDGKYVYFDNTSFKKTDLVSLEEFKEFLDKRYGMRFSYILNLGTKPAGGDKWVSKR
ncbi:MAG: transglutaminase-like domain-containing protein [Candidatus Omnitrophota bacterium]